VIVKSIDSFETYDWLLNKHYAKRIPSISYAFGLYIDNVLEPFITATFKFRNQEDFDFFNNFLKKELYKEKKIFDGMQKKDKKTTWYPLNEKANKYLVI